MKFFYHGKDGGPDSNVEGYWLCEIKNLFSIALLKFNYGSREAFHNHAFNSISWVLKGDLREIFLVEKTKNNDLASFTDHYAGFKPILTNRNTFHKVYSYGTTWVLTFRGAWSKQWKEYLPKDDKFITLENGRKIVE